MAFLYLLEIANFIVLYLTCQYVRIILSEVYLMLFLLLDCAAGWTYCFRAAQNYVTGHGIIRGLPGQSRTVTQKEEQRIIRPLLFCISLIAA